MESISLTKLQLQILFQITKELPNVCKDLISADSESYESLLELKRDLAQLRQAVHADDLVHVEHRGDTVIFSIRHLEHSGFTSSLRSGDRFNDHGIFRVPTRIVAAWPSALRTTTEFLGPYELGLRTGFRYEEVMPTIATLQVVEAWID